MINYINHTRTLKSWFIWFGQTSGYPMMWFFSITWFFYHIKAAYSMDFPMDFPWDLVISHGFPAAGRHLGRRLGPRRSHLALPGPRCLAHAEEGAETCLGAWHHESWHRDGEIPQMFVKNGGYVCIYIHIYNIIYTDIVNINTCVNIIG